MKFLVLISVILLQTQLTFAADELKVKMSGDLRVRAQTEKDGSTEERPRFRYSAKIGLTAQASEEFKAVLRLMTDSAYNSSNITFGDKDTQPSARRTIDLDHAYFQYTPNTNLELTAGRAAAPFKFAGQNQVLLDRDIAHEGFSAKYTFQINENNLFQLSGMSSWLQEKYDSTNGKNDNDINLNAAQLIYEHKNDNFSASIGAGQYTIAGLSGSIKPSSLKMTSSSTESANAKGNTLDASDFYLYDYNVQQLLADIKTKINDTEFTLFGESLKNTKANSSENASIFGLLIDYGPLSTSLSQIEVQKDSVFALYTNSDFAGGTTSSKGLLAVIAYNFDKKTQLSITHYANKKNFETTEKDYTRTNIDFSYKF